MESEKVHTTTFADVPELYDTVFGYRNIPREADFMEAAFEAHFGRRLESVIDLACGTGVHALELTRRGIRVTGLDKSEPMLNWAREKAARERLDIDFRAMDMADFRLEEEYDCAICMLHSLACLLSNRELLEHFLCASRVLADQGLYIIELGNPRPWIADPARARHERWDAGSWIETRDGVRIRANCFRDPVDYISETTRIDMVVDVTGRGVSRRITETLQQRLLLPQTLRALATAGGRFKLSGYYGDFSLQQPLDESPRSWRMIGVFARTGKPPRKREDANGDQTLLAC
jgi:SAM-dependent methyltransferase